MCTILYIHVHAVTAPLHTFISQEMSATVNSLCGSLGTPCSLREVVSIVSGWREHIHITGDVSHSQQSLWQFGHSLQSERGGVHRLWVEGATLLQ